MPISDELAAVYVTAPSTDYYVETMQLTHPGFTDLNRFITNQITSFTGDVDGTQVVFNYVPFIVVPPSAAENAALSIQVAIDNVSRVFMDELESIAQAPTVPIELRYRVYLNSDPNTVQNDPPLKLDVMSVTATQQVISFNAGMTNLRGKPFPSTLYSTKWFRGLSR